MKTRTSTETLIEAMKILAVDIQSEDGVANAAIAEAAQRLEELYNLASEAEDLFARQTYSDTDAAEWIKNKYFINDEI
jgi:sirohydrochlorin ferrochelatase